MLKQQAVLQLSRLSADAPSARQASSPANIEVCGDQPPEQTTYVHDVQSKDLNAHGEARHAVSEAIKLAIRALRESSDAFPPLKSLFGGLASFIDNYEVWGSLLGVICFSYTIKRNERQIRRTSNVSSQEYQALQKLPHRRNQVPGSVEGELQKELERKVLHSSLPILGNLTLRF